MSGFGFPSHIAFKESAASTRYGGIVDRMLLFKSRHVQAVSVKTRRSVGLPGTCQPGGHPAHGCRNGGPPTGVGHGSGSTHSTAGGVGGGSDAGLIARVSSPISRKTNRSVRW